MTTNDSYTFDENEVASRYLRHGRSVTIFLLVLAFIIAIVNILFEVWRTVGSSSGNSDSFEVNNDALIIAMAFLPVTVNPLIIIVSLILIISIVILKNKFLNAVHLHRLLWNFVLYANILVIGSVFISGGISLVFRAIR